MVLSDLILGRESPWTGVYEPTRFNASASTRGAREVQHRVDAPLLRGPAEGAAQRCRVGLDRGEAKIVDSEEGPVGVYRDERGEVHTVSAVCPHMGCHVEWNDGEESWDCPCHGSRFDYDGRVVHTPAVSDLETFSERELSAIGVGVAQERSAEGDD